MGGMEGHLERGKGRATKGVEKDRERRERKEGQREEEETRLARDMWGIRRIEGGDREGHTHGGGVQRERKRGREEGVGVGEQSSLHTRLACTWQAAMQAVAR